MIASRSTYQALQRVKRGLERAGVPASVTRRLAGPIRAVGSRHREREVQVFNIGGIRVAAPSKFVANFVQTEYEPELVAFLRSHLGPGGVVIDAGAHVGYLTVLMAQLVRSQGHVFAIEPSLENVELLRRNIAANGVANVDVLPVALQHKPGLVTFHLNSSSDSYGLFDHPNTATTSIQAVPAVSMDALFDDYPMDRLDLVKLDVEGAEVEVLEGMSGLRERFPATPLVVEWFPAAYTQRGIAHDELPRRLEGMGLVLTVLDPLNGGPSTVAAITTAVAAGDLPTHWYCNLLARPSSRMA